MKISAKPFGHLLVVVSIVVLYSAAAQAQVPPSAQPGIVTRSLEQPDRARARLEETMVIPKEDQAPAQGSTEKVFVLNSVVLDGSSVYTADDFATIYKPYLGQKVSFSDLNAIAQGMTRKYREDGFVFSRAVLPP